MTADDAHDIPETPVAPVPPGAMMLELVMLPVTDIDRAKAFYTEQAGFALDVDVAPVEGVRIVQLTPPGSYCSVTMASGLGDAAAPGSVRGLHLVVADIEAARARLVARGVDVEPVVDRGGGVLYAGFSDPDGNTWTLQHMPWRA